MCAAKQGSAHLSLRPAAPRRLAPALRSVDPEPYNVADLFTRVRSVLVFMVEHEAASTRGSGAYRPRATGVLPPRRGVPAGVCTLVDAASPSDLCCLACSISPTACCCGSVPVPAAVPHPRGATQVSGRGCLRAGYATCLQFTGIWSSRVDGKAKRCTLRQHTSEMSDLVPRPAAKAGLPGAGTRASREGRCGRRQPAWRCCWRRWRFQPPLPPLHARPGLMLG